MSFPRILASVVAGLLAAVGAALLLMREESHFVRQGLPAALLVAVLGMTLTWRSLSD